MKEDLLIAKAYSLVYENQNANKLSELKSFIEAPLPEDEALDLYYSTAHQFPGFIKYIITDQELDTTYPEEFGSEVEDFGTADDVWEFIFRRLYKNCEDKEASDMLRHYIKNYRENFSS